MTQPAHDDEPVAVEALRSRVHKLADMVQGHDGTLREHAILLRGLKDDHASLRAAVATREQLENVAASMAAQVQHFHMENTLKLETNGTKLQHVSDSQDRIQKAAYWIVGLIIAAFVGTVWTVIMKGPPIP